MVLGRHCSSYISSCSVFSLIRNGESSIPVLQERKWRLREVEQHAQVTQLPGEAGTSLPAHLTADLLLTPLQDMVRGTEIKKTLSYFGKYFFNLKKIRAYLQLYCKINCISEQSQLSCVKAAYTVRRMWFSEKFLILRNMSLRKSSLQVHTQVSLSLKRTVIL